MPQRAFHPVFLGLQAIARHLVHGQGVQRNIRARPGVGRRREVVRIGLTGDFEHRDLNRLGHGFALGEPLAVRPALQQGLRRGVAVFGQLRNVVKGLEHQQSVLEFGRGPRGQCVVAQQSDQGFDVVAAVHIAQQCHRVFARDQPALGVAFGDGGQKTGFDVGRLVYARRHTIGQQIQQKSLFAGRRRFDQLDQRRYLLGGQGFGRDALGGAFGLVVAIGVEHGLPP